MEDDRYGLARGHMSKLRFRISVSLNGFVAGPDQKYERR